MEILDLVYLVIFGYELAVVSILPLLFMDMVSLSVVQAGMPAASFVFMNSTARPGGGFFLMVFSLASSLIFFYGDRGPRNLYFSGGAFLMDEPNGEIVDVLPDETLA